MSVLGKNLVEGIDARWISIGTDKSHKFGARVIKVLTQAVGKLSSKLFKLLGKDFLHLRFATPTAGTSLRAFLDGRHRRTLYTKFLDNRSDSTTSNVVTGADKRSGIGRHCFFDGSTTTGRRWGEESSRACREFLIFANGKLVKSCVIGSVANKNATTELGSFLVEDEFTINTVDRVVPHKFIYILVIRLGLINTKRGNITSE
mmetsp:Transcript_28476/g.51603  ORF Transcript_28476/g.51603 Transcript_28476/m.51603 type:complete len:203 (+) Transcript_28476:1698-2306(+)